jgi:lysophospholipase L1-like esterase
MKKYFITFLIILLLTILTGKIFDIFLNKYYGLGSPVLYEYSKIVGYKIKPSQKLKRLGNDIKINSIGMRSNSEWNDDKKDLKILFFGDSVTYGGSIVSNEDLFTEIICKNLDSNSQFKSKCGNYGTNGYGIEQISKKIKYKNINNEDFLVITLIENDLIRGFNSLGSQPYWSKDIPGFYPAITEVIMIILEKTRNNLRFIFDNNLSEYGSELYYNDILNELKHTLKSNNKNFLIIYSPEKSEINKNKNSFFKNYLKNNFINFVDLSDQKYALNKEIFHDDVHLNRLGHKLYGDIISKEILKILNIN